MPCDYKLYPANWQEIRARILTRAGHKCEQCGVANRAVGYRKADGSFEQIADCLDNVGMEADQLLFEGIKTIVIVLTISHTDHDLSHNTDDNLRALCQRCHNRHDVGHRAANRRATIDARKGQAVLFALDTPTTRTGGGAG